MCVWGAVMQVRLPPVRVADRVRGHVPPPRAGPQRAGAWAHVLPPPAAAPPGNGHTHQTGFCSLKDTRAHHSFSFSRSEECLWGHGVSTGWTSHKWHCGVDVMCTGAAADADVAGRVQRQPRAGRLSPSPHDTSHVPDVSKRPWLEGRRQAPRIGAPRHGYHYITGARGIM